MWSVLQKLGEPFELGGVQVGGGAEDHAILLPEDQVVSADRLDFRDFRCFRFAGPDKDVDEVFLAPVDECGNIAMI